MKIRTEFLPYAVPYYDDEEIQGVVNVLKSNWWTKGPVTNQFEQEFATAVGAKYALAVNSCTAALALTLSAYGIGSGCEVIAPSMTFCSTINTIVNSGATPVFCDIEFETGLIDPDKIEGLITDKTRAILPVHYAGQSCDMDKINAIAKKHNLIVIEDAAHAYPTEYKGKMIGGNGNATSFSFYVTKNMSTAEGGMLTSNDEKFMEKARIMSLHGMSKNAWNRYGKGGSWRYDVVCPGFKYNMTDIAASLGLAQMHKIDKMQEIRYKYADYYDRQIDKIDGISYLKDKGYGKPSKHLYVILIDNSKFTIGRDEFIEELGKYNIGTSVHFIPVHIHPYYVENFGVKEGALSETERFFEGNISLPMYPSMTQEDLEYVAQAVKEIAEKYAK